MKSYEEVVEYLYTQLPAYQRIGAAAYKPDIGNIVELCQILDNPQLKFKSIHIAGTNGKGSVAHMLASVYHEAGYSTGLYTSPHLLDFRERVKINGIEISKEDVVQFVEDYQSEFEKIEPSFFEWTVALAFYHFAKSKVDIAIVETGLGGRLDSTNILLPEVSIITSVSMDHMTFLGNDLKSIAREKGGIIKDGTPVVLGNLKVEALEEILLIAGNRKSQVLMYDLEKSSATDLMGEWQQTNSRIVKTTLGVINDQIPVQLADISKGLLNVRKNTGLRGRWEILSGKPLTICDIGHNEEAFMNIVEEIANQDFEELYMVLGFAGDKELVNILKILPKTAIYICCQPAIERAMSVDRLFDTFENAGFDVVKKQSCKEALQYAQDQAADQDLIYIGGSTFVLSEILQ